MGYSTSMMVDFQNGLISHFSFLDFAWAIALP